MNIIDPLKKNMEILQQYIDEIIYKKSQNYSDSYSIKYNYLSQEKKKSVTEDEIEKISDELMLLIRNTPILKQIVREIKIYPNFLWDSSFIEYLNKDEKHKYYDFNSSKFDEREFIKNPSLYSDELPYLSQIIDYKVYIQYLEYLKTLIPSEKPQNFKTSSFTKPSEKKHHTAKPKEENKAQSFRANFENWQIDILTQCINEARIFSKTITSDTMNEIFMCTLKQPLIIANRKNKLFAYFFTALDDRSLIVEDWQSLSARKSLFLSYNGTLLKQNNISTAVKDSREKPPKDCHIIDKYIKQLKKQ